MPDRHTITWDEFHRDCKGLAAKLKGHWIGIIAVTRGGLVPAAIVATELEIKQIETISISSYHDQTRGGAEILKNLDLKLTGDGAGWLVIDDLVDSGATAKILREKLPKAHIATVYAKPEGEKVVDTYHIHFAQDTWIDFPWEIV